ncbi:putative ATP-dependent RNA helicase DDX41 [Stylophora pistillata]|uniref:RNA helicase n=1 Tax=Stylophora pistillata TaxID=50429 RepID=A0A2B4RYL1_STYPI|nr:putative ATP-dependent RNA helicase DDX41 [Stylophora pistillata]
MASEVEAKGERSKDDFIPLRTITKRNTTGQEDNFMKSYYEEVENITQLSEEKIDEIRWQNGIEIQGDNCPKPITSFRDLNLPPELQQYLQNNGYISPTAIQMQALRCVMSGRDLIGLAETGSGKTLAYSLPLSRTTATVLPNNNHGNATENTNSLHLNNSNTTSTSYLSDSLPYSMLNTGSLGMPSYHRVSSDLASFPYSSPVGTPISIRYKSVGICGGVPVSVQAQEIGSGVDVVIATPGWLLDLYERGLVSLDKVSYLVMDEADKMLGMGLEEQLRKVVGLATGTVKARQTLLWTATMPDSLERLARSAVLDPITIQVGPVGLISPTIQQNVMFLYHYEKPEKLLQVLQSTPSPPVIVFTSSIQNVDYVTELLKKEQFHASGLHSEKPQDYRFTLVRAFRDGKVDVLVATDVGSRGLDFPEVTHIINYDLPDSIEDYVHRCGRTGRMGHFGVATSFLTLDCKIAEQLKEMLEVMDQVVPNELENTKQFGKKIIKTEFGDRVVDF